MALWNKIGDRGNVDDRRGNSSTLVGGGLGTIILVMGITYLMGGNPLDVLLQVNPSPFEITSPADTAQYAGNDEYEQFVATVLGSTNAYWEAQFKNKNLTYTPPKLVLFRQSTDSDCGGAFSNSGPHYCPLDSTIYLDETFFDDIKAKLDANNGDVAQAYVIGHEVGHHVQDLLDDIDVTDDSNQTSVKIELQADCYAGLWASSLNSQGVLLPGEISEALDTAAAVGDDRIQSKTTGKVTKETWTHGSSQERMTAFNKGYESGNITSCPL